MFIANNLRTFDNVTAPQTYVTVNSTSPTCTDLMTCRTIENIIWNCLATIFACTWVALHPNVPSLDDSQVKVVVQLTKLMVLALIAPEGIILWAMRQWLVARNISREHNLTMVHGFFVDMGGFMSGPRIVTQEMLQSEPSIRRDVAAIDPKDIADRSKGDALTKGFAVLQTSWFIMQCIARAVQRLPITTLELATIAFASLNVVTYLFWWNKPLSVRRPVHVTAFPPLGIRSVWDSAKRLPLMWAGPQGQLGARQNHLAAGAAIFLGIVFGAIHCIAWSFYFPSRPEQILWRGSSVVVTAVPLVIYFLREVVHVKEFFPQFGRGIVLDVVFAFGALLYLLARVVLLVQMFVSLRDLSAATYQSVDWVAFLPHL